MSGLLPFAEAEIETSLIARWDRAVAHFPQALAVTTVSGERFTYQAIDQAANRLAHALLAELGPTNEPVFLLLGHAPAMIIGILGTLKANKAYVALDPTQPVGQLELLCAQTAARLMVTDQNQQAMAQALATVNEQCWLIESLPTTDQGAPDVTIAPDAIAGIFFTSGTINQPKGVPRSHRTILHRIWFGTSLCHFGPGHHISGIRQCGLGGGVADLFNALLNGATYCLYPLQTDGLQGLSAWLQHEKITYFHPPIILFRQWLDTLAPDACFPHLRQILPSGRKNNADLARLWPHVSANCVVLTSYSATETTEITCTVLDRSTPTAEGVLHVGQPLPGKTVLVLDEAGQPAATGMVGEIVVRSRYISSSYWRQPELTAARFRLATDGSDEICYYTGDLGRRRADGFVELVGRRDSQVKLRGYRIVLSEIEDALQALPSVQTAVVTADEERGLLQAYLVAATEPPMPPAQIRAALAERFPVYALPTHLSYLPSLPLLPSGKVNRQALPAPAQSRPLLPTPYQGPRTALESQVTTLWEELLQLQPIGIDDNFFELGGHSLLAMRLMVKIEQQFAAPPTLSDFFRRPTIAHLAALLTGETATTAIIAPEEDLFARLAATLPPAQVAAVRTIYTQIGQPDQPQQWRKASSLRWHRRRKALHYAGQLLPAPLSWQLLTQIATTPRLRSRCFAREEALIRRFLQTIDTPHQDEQTVARALLCGLVHHYGIKLRATNDPAQVKQSLAGAAAREQRGRLFVRSHEALADHFDALGIASYRVGQIQNHIPKFQFDDAIVENALYTHQLNTARQVLQQGGTVNISADGIQGYSAGLVLDFHQRRRPFWPSFAELAVMTGAQVHMIKTTLSRTNAGALTAPVRIQVSAPLDSGNEQQAYAARVERLVLQYVDGLRQMWAETPWLVPWYQMKQHLAYPASKVDPGR